MLFSHCEYIFNLYFCVSVLIISHAVLLNNTEKRDLGNSLRLSPVPWLGVLVFKEDVDGSSSVAGVILIRHKLAIGNARDLAKLKQYQWDRIKNSVNIMFLTSENKAWHAKVDEIILHPDYDNVTLATVGLLKLKYNTTEFSGDMVKWPSMNSKESYKNRRIFTVGYTDRNLLLEQIVYRMAYVSIGDCQNFYEEEELDTMWMRPVKYHCYKVHNSKNNCVFDPGLALVDYTAGKWTLIGISTWGPGCSLPARFVDFEYFIPWIQTKMAVARRSLIKDDPSEHEDMDLWVVERIDDGEMVLRPVISSLKTGRPDEIVHGKCTGEDTRNGQLIYRDRMIFTTSPGAEAIAVYAFSFYDRSFNKKHYTCVKIYANCKSKSTSRLWYTKSFEQPQLTSMVMTIPHKEDKDTYVYHILDDWAPYNFDIIKSDITNLIFRFEFQTEAYFDIHFYGNLTADYTTTTTESTRTTTVNYSAITRTPWNSRGVVMRADNLKDDTLNYWSRWWRSQLEPDNSSSNWRQGYV